MQYGPQCGHVFGVVGNTDHHSAHPGSYGHGATGLWAGSLTRQAIWEALEARRTYAITGDRIRLQFALNDACMGAVIPLTSLRRLAIEVHAGGAIDSPAYRFHRAPLPWEFEWTLALDDAGSGPDVYYVRVRQKNDQWAWSSPVFLR